MRISPSLSYHLDLVGTNWQVPEQFPELRSGQVHVWRLPLDADQKKLARLIKLLAPAERTYAEHSYFERGYRERVMSRAALRTLLGYYLSDSPEKIKIDSSKLGKPYLAEIPNLYFNVSHAGDYALLAFTHIAEIGVDLEVTNRRIKIASLVNRFFSRVEVPVILDGERADQVAAFFRAWTRKEAVIKATGDGLTTPLDEFGVSIQLSEPVRVLHTDWKAKEIDEWSLRSFTVTEELPGAIALKGTITDVVFYDLTTPLF